MTEPTLIFDLELEPEDIPVRGNLVCSDDPEQDKRDEDDIIARLERDFVEAWCCIKVECKLAGTPYRGLAYLGCCSFDNMVNLSEVEAMAHYHGMYEEAEADLRASILRAAEQARAAQEALAAYDAAKAESVEVAS